MAGPRIRIAKREEWMQRGACVGHNPNWWFPPKGNNIYTAKAKAICAGCEVRQTCLQHAIDNGERMGIWGGVTTRRVA